MHSSTTLFVYKLLGRLWENYTKLYIYTTVINLYANLCQ